MTTQNPNHNPIGEHRQNMHSASEDTAVEHARKGKLITSTALNAFGLARKWADIGMSLPVFRDYNLELFHKDSQGKVRYPNAQAVWDYMRRVCDENNGERRVLFNVTCEMDMTPALYSAYIQLMDLSASSGSPIGMVFSNAAWLPSWWDKQGNHYKEPMALAYLNKLHEMSGVKLANGQRAFWHGDHQYSIGYFCSFSNAGQFLGNPQSAFSAKWETGEYVIDWSKPQWHLGSKMQGQMDALGWRWDHPTHQWVAQDGRNPHHRLPATILTEVLFGSMSQKDFLAAHPNWINTPPWNEDVRGYRANERQWAAWYPELFAQGGMGRVLTEMQVQAWKYIWTPLESIVGTHHFSWGDTGGWSADNTTSDTGYWNSVVNVRLPIPLIDGIAIPTPPQPPQLPLPTDSRWAAMKAQAKVSAGVNVRSKPTTTADRIGGIQYGGVLIHTIPYAQLGDLQAIAKPGGVEWYLVKLENKTIGWVHSNYLTLDAIEPTPPAEEWRQKLLTIADTLIEVGNIGLTNSNQAKEAYERQIEMLVAIRNDLENAQ